MFSNIYRSVLAVGLGMAAFGVASPATAADGLFSGGTASVTYGPYVRFEFGQAMGSLDGSYWAPPGAADPSVQFDLGGDNGFVGGVAIGYDWLNGFRADIGFLKTGSDNFSGPCSSASDGTACVDHASITGGSIDTTALMGSLFYSPLEQRGSNSVFQPFIVGGIGVARNEVGPWTRENAVPPATREFRTFEGDSTDSLAWSIGVGASLQITKPGKHPIILEASWRYYDFGTAKGGSTPLPGEGSGSPIEPLTFQHREQVVSIGVRIPLQRY